MVLLIAVRTAAQPAAKPIVSEKDYHLWHRLQPGKISDNGQWASFGITYDSGKDTLIVKNTKSETVYRFPKGTAGAFGGMLWFACRQQDTLVVQNLDSGKQSRLPNTGYFAFTSKGRYLLVCTNQQGGGYNASVRDGEGHTVAAIPNVKSFALSSDGQLLAYATNANGQYKAGLLQFGQKWSWHTMAENTVAPYNHFVLRGKTVAFIRAGADPQLCHYNLEKKKLATTTAATLKGFPTDSLSIQTAYNPLQLSPDGQRLFFMMKENNVPVLDPGKVQVWNTADRQIYTDSKKNGDPQWADKRAVWFPDSGSFLRLNDRALPKGLVSGDGRWYLSWDPLAYEPQSNLYGPVDVYLTEITTGNRKLVVEKQPYHSMQYMFSPDCRYLSYFKNKHWWVYDIRKRSHTNITSGLPVTMVNENYDYAGALPAYGSPGWTAGDAAVLVYDQFDIWEIAPDGKNKQRLTQGREQQLQFRLETIDDEQPLKIDAAYLATGRYEIENRLILHATDMESGASGYCLYKRKSGATRMTWTKNRCGYFRKAAKRETILYMEEHYDEPPKLMQVETNGVAAHAVFQSNPQHSKYRWGKSETLNYRANGSDLKGVLLYPAGFKEGTRYPMIVNVYEEQQRTGLTYENPSIFNETGINFRNLTAAGYFVLLPDIIYGHGNLDLAETMTACVLAGVDAALLTGHIDAARMGLTGHSFGGYETDMILTRTSRFATAVSGAAFTNQISTYFSIGRHGTPDWWKAEHQQLRIGKSFFEAPESYLRSSPVLQAAAVNTPLLSWAGDRDFHVHYQQSIEFYLALRRLGKTHTLLLYPNEGHVLSDPANQADATRRIQAWFDSYLKPVTEPSCSGARKS